MIFWQWHDWHCYWSCVHTYGCMHYHCSRHTILKSKPLQHELQHHMYWLHLQVTCVLHVSHTSITCEHLLPCCTIIYFPSVWYIQIHNCLTWLLMTGCLGFSSQQLTTHSILSYINLVVHVIYIFVDSILSIS